MTSLTSRLLSANELGIRLEIVGGMPLWEAQPDYKHQKAVDRNRASINPSEDMACGCVHVADVYINFPDGSIPKSSCMSAQIKSNIASRHWKSRCNAVA